MKNNNWVRGAMLLAVGLVLQALRLVIPMPPMWTVFVVGTLVNMVLVLAARTVGLWPSVMIAVLLPPQPRVTSAPTSGNIFSPP